MADLPTAIAHRGEVWWANVPGDKRRPVLILTREQFISRLNALLVAPLTTTVRHIPTEIALGPHDGLSRDCAANFDNTFTLRREHFIERITQVSSRRNQEICSAYRFAAGC